MLRIYKFYQTVFLFQNSSNSACWSLLFW